MKFIANILTEEPFDNWELYNITNSTQNLIKEIPTLIVGWDLVKKLYPDASIIEWEITQNVFWTYGKYEKREKYEENLKKFQDMVVKKCIEKINYVFFDIITQNKERFENFLKTIKSDTPKTIYVLSDMLYVYFEGLTKVVGLSLRDCDYLDENYKKSIFSAIYNNPLVQLLKNNENITRETRYRMKGRVYMLPYLYSNPV